MTTSLSRWQIGTTISILVLSIVSTLLGLFRPGHYRDHPDFLTALYVQDLTILLVGVPVLALGLLLASRGSLRGYLVWLGALAYMTYMWASIAFSVAWNEFFLGYVVLFGLSLFALISGFVGIDEDQVYREIHGRVSPVVYIRSSASTRRSRRQPIETRSLVEFSLRATRQRPGCRRPEYAAQCQSPLSPQRRPPMGFRTLERRSSRESSFHRCWSPVRQR